MASFEKLPSGRFRGIYYDHGKKKRVPGTFRLQSEALAAAEEKEVEARRRAQLAVGTLPATITWNEWWGILSADRVFESDTGDVERRLVKNHISPRWGGTALSDIDRGVIQQWIKDLGRSRTPTGKLYEPSYVRRIYNCFAMSLRAAVAHDPPMLSVSPLVRIELPALRRKRKAFVPMEEAPDLEAELRDDYADTVAFGLETGLRPGELAGLHDNQVDVAGMLLWVTTAYVLRARKMRERPKDDDARTVPLSAAALAIYLRRIEGRDMRRPCGMEHYDGRCAHDVVFRTARGAVLNPSTLSSAMHRAADRAGLAGRSSYALRRGFATRLARGGIDQYELMDIMGWSDPRLAREYIQKSAGVRDRLLAALGDPSATGLRVAGQPPRHGTKPGTTAVPEVPEVTGKSRRRRTS